MSTKSKARAEFALLDRRRLRRLRQAGLEFHCFFDVGASNGAWTRHLRPEFPDADFELFEPLAEHVPGFRSRMRGVLGRRARLHPFALGSRRGPVEMCLFPHAPSGSTALLLAAPPSNSRRIMVEMTTIDALVEEGVVARPQVIKIDTQGCELHILEGGRRTLPAVAVLVLECWLVRDYGPATPLMLEVASWLRQLDFHLWDFGDQWRNPAGELVTQDCLFLNARCRVSRQAREPRLLQETSLDTEYNRAQPWLQRFKQLLLP